jgi:hypothetical protein
MADFLLHSSRVLGLHACPTIPSCNAYVFNKKIVFLLVVYYVLLIVLSPLFFPMLVIYVLVETLKIKWNYSDGRG